MLSSFVVLVGVVAQLAAADLVRMEPKINHFTSSLWLKENSLRENDQIKMNFILKHDSNARAQFEKELLSLSTPGSANYAKWMKPEDIQAKLSPSEDKVKVVTDFLKSNGVTTFSVNKFRDVIHVTVPAKLANQLLQTEFALFRSAIQRDVALPRITKPYYLPQEVAEVVNLVDDILRFPSIRSSLRSVGAEATADPEFSSCGTKCNGYTTPDVLQTRYKYDSLKKAAKGNSMSVAEFQLQYYDNTDLSAFSSNCGVTAAVDKTIGGNVASICEKGGCIESLLDIEYIEAVANPIPLTVIYSSTYSLSDWIDGVISMSNPPLVHSVSYGNDEVQQTSTQYMESVNDKFMAAGALGLSILFASGDQGVWGRSGVGSTYHPDFPGSSPYVTAVGGTDFAQKSTIGDETTWSCGGGGFSDTFSTPSWQADAVSQYLKTATAKGVLPSASLFNASGRAYPDVSALAGQVNPYCIAIRGGSFSGVSGTSASCPVVAGIFAQLNDVRLNAGKTPLGWLNPFIYSLNGKCFNDVNDGSQNNCNKGTTGFAALTSFDPATGWGTPDYSCLSKEVLKY